MKKTHKHIWNKLVFILWSKVSKKRETAFNQKKRDINSINPFLKMTESIPRLNLINVLRDKFSNSSDKIKFGVCGMDKKVRNSSL